MAIVSRTENYPSCDGMTKQDLALGIALISGALIKDLMRWRRSDLVQQYRSCSCRALGMVA